MRFARRADSHRSIGHCSRWSLAIGRNRRLELLVEAFNVTNYVNFRPPPGNPPGAGVPIISSSFLIRTSASHARQLQWGVRYSF